MKFEILHEDNHLLVINKPPGWVVQGAQPNQPSVIKEVGDYLRIAYQKPGNVFVGVVSRLDAPVTGVLPLARTSKGASRLNDQIRDRQVEKRYWALVQGRLPNPTGTLRHWLRRNEQDRVTTVSHSNDPSAQEAILHYEQMESSQGWSWLSILLETGRKHQIRSQLREIGHPIVGDTIYDGPRWPYEGIALHCFAFACAHPTLKTPLRWKALPPKSWRDYLETNGSGSLWITMDKQEVSS